MVNRNLYLKIIGSVSLIVLFALLGSVLLITGISYFLSSVCLCVILLITLLLIQWINGTNRKIAIFFESVRNGNTTLRYPDKTNDPFVKDLYAEMNRIILLFSQNQNEMEEKRMNQLMCRDIHGDCSLYFTEGILKNPVRRNYQYEYAKRLKNKNIWLYHDKHRIVKRNIALLTEMLKKSLVIKSESQEILSDRGTIVPSRLWRLGRSGDAKVFKRELKGDSSDFVVDVLIDASGSQMSRQGEVALQAYIISESLSNAGLPHRVMSYCTFWDYTILHRFREYDDPRSANENIFNYVTSSNNRDGLAIRAAGYGLLMREEEKKILIILSDGRPYDVVVNRPNARNPQPYHGKYAITDTAAQIRKLRSQGVSVLGVFAGEEKDLATEKKIFGKDFAYIRNITGFSKIVGRYLTKQLEDDE